ncbi:MAG: hypothetical protein H0X07_10075, partial [Gemmatimonadales bacterium]|nr:hypothetical protein [Gemmatimonadales bacterium]
MQRITRLLYGLAAVLLLAGLVLRVAPAPTKPARPPVAPSSKPVDGTRKTAAEAPAIGAAIVSANVFSASRSAPRVRYVPPDLAPSSPEPVSTQQRPPVRRLRLFGTVVGPSGTAALIDADPAVRGAEIYQVGDVVDDQRIVAVSESTVVLQGP